MAEADNKKRYILFSKEDGRPDSEKPCAFFASPAGCRNGAKCKFLHGVPEVKTAKRTESIHTVREDEPKEKKAKKEKKEKKVEPTQAPTPTPVYRPPPVVAVAAPAPKAAPVPQVNANDKLVQDLQRQLMEQQKLLEAQMKLLQQQQQASIPVAAPAPAVAPTKVEVRKENKRKQSAVAVTTPAPVSNKSPKTTSSTGVTLHQVYQPQQAAPSLSARASATFANNVSHHESSDDETDSGDDENDFLFGAVNHVLKTGLQSSNNTTPHKQEALPATSPFVSNQEAVKALHTSNSNHALHGSAKKNIFAAPKTPTAHAAAAAAPAPTPAPVRAPVVPFDPSAVQLDSLAWQQLVVATQGHPRFAVNYGYPENDATWVQAKPYGAWCAQKNLPRVLSMDCEMCETTDPVTGIKCENALVRFSVVDCTDNGNVRLFALQ